MAAEKVFNATMWSKIVGDPSTAVMMADGDLVQRLKNLEASPASAATADLSGDGMAKILQLLGTSKEILQPAPEMPPDDLSEEDRVKWEANHSKEKGNAAYKARDFTASLESYARAFELDPTNVTYLTNQAAAHFELKDYPAAIAKCEEAIKLNDEKSLHTDYKIIGRAYSRIGNCHMQTKEYEKAIEFFEKSLLEANDSKVQLRLLDARRMATKQAEASYQNPELSEQARQKGNDFFRKGQFPDAVKSYTEAVKRNPKDPAAYSNRAAAYTKLGEFPMGLKDCDTCLELDPKYVKAYSRKGAIEFFMGSYHKCLDIYQKGLEIDPSNQEMRDGLRRTQVAIAKQQNSGEVDEKQVQHNMADPEIQSILNDPSVNQVLKELQENPEFGMKAMSNPVMANKINKLIAAGIIRTS